MRIAANPIPVVIAAAWGILLAPSLLHAHGTFHDRVALASSQIEAEPANAGNYLTRSILYRDHGDFATALADLERGAQLDPMRRELGLLYGRLYLAWDQPERALAPLESFLEERQDHPAANVTLARALARLGRHLEAADCYTLAIDHEPVSNPELYLRRAQALLAAGDKHRERALRGLDAGIDRLGPVVGLAMSAIEIEVSLGRFDSALTRGDRLVALSPRQETWLGQRGDILEAAQRREEARASYARVLTEIEKLSELRRRTPAMTHLQSRARAGLVRLERSSE